MGKKIKSQFARGVMEGILLGLTIIILSLIFLAIFSYYTSNTVGYKINIEKEQFIQGDEIILFYEISNYYRINVEDLVFTYYVKDKTNPQEVSINKIGGKSSHKDSVKINTRNLKPGDYTIFTEINWTDPKNEEKKSHSLTLGFELYS